MAQTVPGSVHPTVSTRADTRTDRVLVLQVIRVIIVPQVIISQLFAFHKFVLCSRNMLIVNRFVV